MTEVTGQYHNAYCTRFIRSIDANRTVKDSLVGFVRDDSFRSSVSVAQLADPRRAFHQHTSLGAQLNVEYDQYVISGSGVAGVFDAVIPTDGYVEKLVDTHGVVAKMLIQDDVPIDIRTTDPTSSHNAHLGPYLDILGMYCVMVGSEEGRLIEYRGSGYETTNEIKVYQVRFLDLPAIWAEMCLRRDLFGEAISSGNPDTLPRCALYGMSCEYSEVCGCESARPLSRIVNHQDTNLVDRSDISIEIAERLRSLSVQGQNLRLRLEDIVLPRRASLKRKRHVVGNPVNLNREEVIMSTDRGGFWGSLSRVTMYCPQGEAGLLPVRFGKLFDIVRVHRGLPLSLVKVNNTEMIDRNQLSRVLPVAIDRLGFECAFTNSERGRLVVYYDSIKDDKFMVYDVWFNDLSAIISEADSRRSMLENGTPESELPGCPTEMAYACDFAAECGC